MYFKQAMLLGKPTIKSKCQSFKEITDCAEKEINK